MVDSRRRDVAQSLAERLARYSEVEAVALGGSAVTGLADDTSDIDLYVYLNGELPLSRRKAIANERADPVAVEVGNTFFESGDEWTDAASGIAVDLMYRSALWIEEQISRVLIAHQASLGYTTCFCHNVATSIVLYDRQDWFAA